MNFPNNIESKIGFDQIRNLIKSKCENELGKLKCEEMQFSNNYLHLNKLLLQTYEYLTIIQKENDFPNGTVFDLREPLLKIRAHGTYLTESELYKLGKSLVSATEISNYFTDENRKRLPQLNELASKLILFPQISERISSTLDKFGNVKDNASPELATLKGKLLRVSSNINGMIQRIISQYKQEGVLDKDCVPSVRDGRLVIPVTPMYKRVVKGIVHDESATGKTYFIEPAEVVETNNQIRELEADIRKEIVRILISVSDFIRPYLDDLLGFYNVIGIFDFIRAKASFANEINATLPHLSQTQEIEWFHAIHPILFLTLQKGGKETIPLSIKLDQQTHILLISGPNAGGKSVCLKTVGIIQYMLQCGILPPVYANSHFGIFDNIFIDIGDEQSIENELSTYSSHLSSMNYFMRNANGRTLLLIDEFGGGTEPQIGGAIAQAILKKLNNSKAFGVITTHYQNLKNFAAETEGIVNGAMLYDRNLMKPLFQLSVGMPGSSFAIEIAKKIGIQSDVIEYAEEIVGSDYINMDRNLLDIARDKRYWQNKRQEIRVERKKLESLVEKYEGDIKKLVTERNEIIKEARSEAREIISGSNATIENAIHEIKKVQAEKERTKEIRKQIDELKQRLSSDSIEADNERIKLLQSKINSKKSKKKKEIPITKPEIEPLVVGDHVTIDGSTSVGEIMDITGSNAVVSIGIFKSTVPLDRLSKTIRKASIQQSAKHSISSETAEMMRNKQLKFKQEIDVRGMRADEALQAVSYFIDDAVSFSAKRVRILHGTGYGILRQRIREYLNAVPEVTSFRDEHIQLGGSGITIVELA